MRNLLFLTTVLLIVATAAAQTKTGSLIKSFDSLLTKEFKTEEPGAAAIVVKKGEVVYKKGFGMADMELNVPAQPDMVFRIGSITKQFTAVCILKLASEGKLSLQDDIKKYIPDYGIQEPITIEHLLTHTSGIKSYTNIDTFWNQMRKDMTPREIIRLTEKDSLEFKPGTKYNYNNTAYVMLGYIIEKISGKTYEDYLQQNLFTPLGMSNSYFGSDSRIIKNRAKGYKKTEKDFFNSDYISMTLPHAAGSIISTVEDLWKWNKALYSYKVISKEWVDPLITPYKLANGKSTNYGYGLAISTIQGSPVYSHGGGIPGFLTYGIYMPKEDVFVAVFSNCDCKSPDAAATKMAAIAIGKPYNFTALPLKETEAKPYEGVYAFENEERIIQWKDGKLTSKRGGGNVFELKMYEKDKFFFEGSFSFIEFVKGSSGSFDELIYKNNEESSVWKKTSKPLPQPLAVIKVDPALLADYTGAYQLAPNFILTITQEGDTLFGQATGQGKIGMEAISPVRFKAKGVDAQVEFKKDASGKTVALVLYQNGREIEGKKQ
ncbi:MAG TPA: serine hydrolase [Lacibacter sp.]|nr:serine hydrolase [Lacibacter sp.]